MTPRRAATLAVNLPAGAQVWRAMGQANAWTVEEHLSLSIIDRLNVLVWQKTAAAAKGRDAPKPLPRPGGEESSAADEALAKARAFRERHQQAKELNRG
jgi:hypothetical protein